jgi:hypothetical protein
MEALNEHGDKHPIIECDVVRRKVAAMPAKEYIDGLPERTRETTRRQFEETTTKGGIIVFVKDSKNRVLRSHAFLPEETG